MPPISLLIKPVSGNCNMRCSYCFYIDETQNRSTASLGNMSYATMTTLIDKALSFADLDCTFAFQGGEPTLAGLDFYQSFSSYVENHPNPKQIRIHYAFQTNGILIDEYWAEWFAQNQVLVGISLDGPKKIHDLYRLDRGQKPTFTKVMQAIDLLKSKDVSFNILTVVTSASSYKGKQIYDFFKKNNFKFQQYIECLDPLGAERGSCEYSLRPQQYERFLKDLFDAWYSDMKSGHYVYNRYFENLMMILARQNPESCNLRGFCGPQWVIEADGSVYPCDFYVLDEWKLGNILTDSFEAMELVRQKSSFIEQSKPIPEECLKCKWIMLCRNGCRRNRELMGDGTIGKNYFCSAYYNFLEYAAPKLMELYRLLVLRSKKI
ncbi:MAG: anaerobic sulfatase maturase [bacterium]|nr:anaerobic sulfatase maturase [bacterium]